MTVKICNKQINRQVQESTKSIFRHVSRLEARWVVSTAGAVEISRTEVPQQNDLDMSGVRNF